MPRMKDGSQVSSYFKGGSAPSGQDIYNQGAVFMLGQVDKIHFTDDSSNISKEFVEYDVSCRDANGGQSVFRNVRYQASLGGTNDYDETILEPNDIAFSGKLDATNFFKNKNGTIVILAFLHGSKDKPFIAGTLQHPKRKGAKKADGIRKLGEFRGLEWNINKDGELIVTQRGPRTPKGELKSASTVNTELKLDKSGNVSIKDKESNKIYLDRENKKIVISQDDDNKVTLDRPGKKIIVSQGSDNTVTMDSAAKKITLAAGSSGLQIELDGSGDKATIKSSGGPKIEIDGAGTITMTANSTIIKIDGSSGKIELTGQMVDVGEAASALAALGPQLVAWLTTHVHMGDGGPIPAPTSPPLVPPPASVLSTTVKIKA